MVLMLVVLLLLVLLLGESEGSKRAETDAMGALIRRCLRSQRPRILRVAHSIGDRGLHEQNVRVIERNRRVAPVFGQVSREAQVLPRLLKPARPETSAAQVFCAHEGRASVVCCTSEPEGLEPVLRRGNQIVGAGAVRSRSEETGCRVVGLLCALC